MLLHVIYTNPVYLVKSDIYERRTFSTLFAISMASLHFIQAKIVMGNLRSKKTHLFLSPYYGGGLSSLPGILVFTDLFLSCRFAFYITNGTFVH